MGEIEGMDGTGNGDNREIAVVLALISPSSPFPRFPSVQKYPVTSFQSVEVNSEWFRIAVKCQRLPQLSPGVLAIFGTADTSLC
jgi:hypothetical protein